MTSFVSHTSVDCRDAHALSEWWKEVLGYVDVVDDPNEPGDQECMIVAPDAEGPPLLFLKVPGAKRTKNRIHLDLRPAGGLTRDQELERLLGLGARQVDDRRTAGGLGWVVLADPEGNVPIGL